MDHDPRSFAMDTVLRDGGSIHLRAIRPDDKERLVDHFKRLSARSVYFRFFSSKTRLSDHELRRFTEIDFVQHVAIVATLLEDGEEKIIGVARYFVAQTPPGSPKRAEVAFAIADAHQGRGIATVLLEQLARFAAQAGISEFEADVLGENNRMLSVFGSSGFRVRRSIEEGVFHLTFPVEPTEESTQASHSRERQAAAESLRALLQPRSVAVVGASNRPGSIGNALFANLARAGFTGPLYPVHPSEPEIAGRKAYPRLSAIGAPVDLAVIAVPAAAVDEVVSDAGRARVRAVVVISAGFGEVSPAGREAEQRLKAKVRSLGMRMVGPNCLGIINTDPAIALDATFAPQWPPAGNVGMMSQSGALGLAMLDYAGTRELGLSTFVSVGNKADVSGNDLLAYWAGDRRTEVIVLYLESFGNPRKFARVAPEVARVKPIVALKSGRSSAGARAAASHSAALASLDIAVDALFEQAGVIRTETIEGMLDVVSLLSSQPVPEGARVAVVTNAGGPGIVLADACEARRLALPELSPETRERLRAVLPPQAGLANPVDMIASASADQYAHTVATVGEDDAVDAIVVLHVPTMVVPPREIAEGIARGAGRVPPHKPVLVVFISTDGAPEVVHHGARGRLPCYAFPENAAIALSAAERYGRWRRRPRGDIFTLDDFAASTVRAVADRALADGDAPRWLTAKDVSTILRAVGIEFAAAELVSAADAGDAAERLGYPLVAKLVSPDVVHKSDVGCVRLGLGSAEQVRAAADHLAARAAALGARFDGILLQRQIRGDIEAIVGVATDPTFGPLVVCGLGGVLVELLKDVSFRLPPISDLDASEMLSRLRSYPLLAGYRGGAAGDRDALCGVIRRIAALVEVLPEIRELDLNPIKVLAPGEGAIVVDARIRLGRP